MRCTHPAAFALVIGLATLPGVAQQPEPSVSQELEKGIYAQQTTGDLDAAIQTFRQVIASNPSQRIYAAQAQLHLAQALLQKGDLDEAAQEFSKLAANYSEFRDAIAAMARSMPAMNHARVFNVGETFLAAGEPDRFRDTATGIMLTAPPNTQLEGSSHATGGADLVRFASTVPPTDTLAVWMKPYKSTSTDFSNVLRQAVARKTQDRTGFTGWAVRSYSVRMETVAGQQALSAVADYTDRGKPMVEYLIWVYSAKSHVVFFGRADAADQEPLQTMTDRLANTAEIP